MMNSSNNPLGVRKGIWYPEEDILLRKCIETYGEGKWHLVPLRAGYSLYSFFLLIIYIYIFMRLIYIFVIIIFNLEKNEKWGLNLSRAEQMQEKL